MIIEINTERQREEIEVGYKGSTNIIQEKRYIQHNIKDYIPIKIN